MTILKAPLISRKRAATDLPLSRASSTSKIKQAIRSITKRFGSALKWVLAATWCYIVSRAIFLTRSRSSPLPRQLSRAIGRQELMSVKSRFPTFGIITIRDFLKTFG